MEPIRLPFVVLPYKSMAASILLTVFLGPLGLLYSSLWGGLVMAILIIPGLFMPISEVTVSSVAFFWLLCCFLGAFSTARYNKKLLKRYVDDVSVTVTGRT